MGSVPVNSSEYIYRRLKEEILGLELKPGQSVSENELCARFSVSRTPVRSVLQRLSGDGLVKVVPYQGSFVTLLDFDDIRQMIYMRIAVESAVIRDFIGVCTPIVEEKLRYVIRKQIVLSQETDLDMSRFYEVDSQLHKIWFQATKREKLWELIQRSQVNYTRFRMLDITAVQDLKTIIEEHEALFALIHEKRPGEVEPLVRKHLNGGIVRLGERMRTDFQDYFQPET